MSRKAKANLLLESGMGCLFLVFVALVGLLGLLFANWIAYELLTLINPGSPTDGILYSPRSFLSGLAILFVFAALLALAAGGTRWLLVQPEPPPWIDGDENNSHRRP